ncbi:toll-like receptor 3 isoform X2 [Toxorhynchites rutilus septentrionalis]|uniref:toll-like receptor 3 isoform X2 n=1 Tax=Toxorhynchites rutilus septentrionalis TaxID=329112 RepID=UPI0024798868|nr:toll-like receptor 3 isoform X2 [Toxorhynchites rutilus septentrionalis]
MHQASPQNSRTPSTMMNQPKFSAKQILLTLSALITLTLSYANGFATLATDMDRPQRCQLERIYKMAGYNCANLNLKEIPQSLKSNLQIFDLSYNRIRDLNRQSFARYTDIKYLYLFENMIQNIEEGTFSDLTTLEAIDLSHNALKSIPLELFRLPILRNLYVASNALHDLERDLELLEKPIKAPLQVLSLADCWLTRLPNFGILPDLWQLNISSNPMTELDIDHFSPMCHLRSLDTNNTQIPICACQSITTELTARRVTLINIHPHCKPLFATEQNICTQGSTTTPIAPSSEYDQCMEVRKSRKLDTEAKTAWLKISLGVLGCILVFSLVLYCFHKRNAKTMENNNKFSKSPPPPINRLGGEASIVENGKREKLINDCD